MNTVQGAIRKARDPNTPYGAYLHQSQAIRELLAIEMNPQMLPRIKEAFRKLRLVERYLHKHRGVDHD